MSPGVIGQSCVNSRRSNPVTGGRRRGRVVAADGYARTTLAKIAAAAGVSAETVQGQGPKAALLIAAAEFAGVGVSDEKNLSIWMLAASSSPLTTPGKRSTSLCRL